MRAHNVNEPEEAASQICNMHGNAKFGGLLYNKPLIAGPTGCEFRKF